MAETKFLVDTRNTCWARPRGDRFHWHHCFIVRSGRYRGGHVAWHLCIGGSCRRRIAFALRGPGTETSRYFAKTCASCWPAPTKMRQRWTRILNRGNDEHSATASDSIQKCSCVPI